jgi:hypothetical protein
MYSNTKGNDDTDNITIREKIDDERANDDGINFFGNVRILF